jgi:hypothetical protein
MVVSGGICFMSPVYPKRITHHHTTCTYCILNSTNTTNNNNNDDEMEALRRKDEEMAAIRQALSPNSFDEDENNVNVNDNDNDKIEREEEEEEDEVHYHEGATPLFLAIESTDWRRALQIVQHSPAQARTWVSSLGTVENNDL